MLQTSCCPFSIGVCAGCWVDAPVRLEGGRGVPARKICTQEFIDQTGSAQLLLGYLLSIPKYRPPNALDQVVIVVSSRKIDLTRKERTGRRATSVA